MSNTLHLQIGIDFGTTGVAIGYTSPNVNAKQENEPRNFSLKSSTKILSLFDCKLTPLRTELLMIGYTKLFASTYISMDIIKLFILYFNEIIYFKHKSIPIDINLDYIINNDFKFNIIHKKSDLRIKLLTNWKIVDLVAFRVRVLYVDHWPTESNDYTVYVLTVKNKELRCFGLWRNETIGIEIEIIHFVWKNYTKCWSKWSYPWNDNKNDLQCLLQDQWFSDFDLHCFAINDTYYVIDNQSEHSFWSNRLQFAKALRLSKCSCIKLKWLDIPRYVDAIGNYHELSQLTCSTMIEDELYFKWKLSVESPIIYNKRKKLNYWKGERYQSKPKLHKTYRNNKRKYQYNRW